MTLSGEKEKAIQPNLDFELIPMEIEDAPF